MAPVSYTDTGAAGTPEPSWVPPTTENAVETNYQQNANLIPALTALGITAIGADASKPYPNPPTDAVRHPTASPYTGGTFAAGTAFADGPAEAVPRHPINIYFNAATQAQMIGRVQHALRRVAPAASASTRSITTCLDRPVTWAYIVNSVESGMFGTVINNDPEPFYAHQTNLIQDPTNGNRTVLRPVLNQLLTELPQHVQRQRALRAADPRPVCGHPGQAGRVERGPCRRHGHRDRAWAARSPSRTTAPRPSAIPVTAPTGTLVEPAGHALWLRLRGSLSDWVTLAPGGTYTLQAPAAPYITTQPANQSLLAGQTATFTAAATNGQANPPATVQWDVSTNNGLTWTPVPGATSPTLTLPSVTGSDEQQRVRGDLHQQPRQRDQQRRPVGGQPHHPDRHAADRVGDHLRAAAGERDAQRRVLQRPRHMVVRQPDRRAERGHVRQPAGDLHSDRHHQLRRRAGDRDLTVNKATPFVSVASKPITYGQTLGSTPLLVTAAVTRGGAPLRGGTNIVQNSRFKPNAGTVTETVTYVPTDSADFNIVTVNIRVTVKKAHPKLSATIRTKKPAGGKLVSVTLTGLQPGARETARRPEQPRQDPDGPALRGPWVDGHGQHQADRGTAPPLGEGQLPRRDRPERDVEHLRGLQLRQEVQDRQVVPR